MMTGNCDGVNDAMEKGEISPPPVQPSPTTSSFSTLIEYSKSLLSLNREIVANKLGDSEKRPTWSEKLWKRSRREVKCRTLESCPRGYPRLAAFLDSDEGFMIYRRFGYVQSRLLLEQQDEMRQLEEELDLVDQEIHRNREADSMTRDLSEAKIQPRRDVLQKLKKSFCEYADLMGAAQKLVALNRPAKSDYNSVHNFVIQGERPLCQEEETWVKHKEDLVTLRPGREHAWLDTALEHVLRWFCCSPIEYLFCSAETKQKTEGRPEKSEIYFTRSRIDGLAISIIMIMILFLLIVPVYLLYHLVSTLGTSRTAATCMGVLLVATLAFSAIISIFTRAKRHEILGAAAAYCAVLVVFLGNVQPQH